MQSCARGSGGRVLNVARSISTRAASRHDDMQNVYERTPGRLDAGQAKDRRAPVQWPYFPTHTRDTDETPSRRSACLGPGAGPDRPVRRAARQCLRCTRTDQGRLRSRYHGGQHLCGPKVWDDVVAFTVEAGWYGAENLSLIPGETGAAAVQNIGAYGIELKDIVDSVEAVERSTGKIRIFNKAECKYAYRESIFKKELKDQYIITHVVLRLQKKEEFHLEYGNIQSELAKFDTLTLKNVRQTIIAIRESKLPDTDNLGNAGSFFMNPYVALPKYLNLKQEYPQMPHYPVSDDLVKVPAAWLIEQCGWKGREWGGAGVHDKQCLVLVNRGGALASDIVDLAANIQTSVKEKFDIDITPEVIYI